MQNMLELFLRLALVLFIAGSLLEMGLRVPLRAASAALGDWRFAGATVLWGFVICPALAIALTRVVPLDPSHAAGLRLLALAPGAPFLPLVAARAGGPLAYAAAFLVVTTIGVVLFMPVAVPKLVSGFTADPWAIARPLLSLIAAPLMAGVPAVAVLMPAPGRRLPEPAGMPWLAHCTATGARHTAGDAPSDASAAMRVQPLAHPPGDSA